MRIMDVIQTLSDLGVLPVILLAAVIGMAVNLYRRFRSGGGGVSHGYDEPGHKWTEEDYFEFSNHNDSFRYRE